MTRVVGITGGVGSGKSTAAKLLAGSDGVRIDADALGHEVLREPAVIAAVRERFGPEAVYNDEVFGATVDRAALGRLVFADPAGRTFLESLTHPRISARAGERVAAARAAGVPLVVVDAALLLEAKWDAFCDEVVFVDAPAAVRKERVKRTRGWSEENWAAREAAQLPLTAKRERADHVLTNDGTEDDLARRAERLRRDLLSADRPRVRP